MHILIQSFKNKISKELKIWDFFAICIVTKNLPQNWCLSWVAPKLLYGSFDMPMHAENSIRRVKWLLYKHSSMNTYDNDRKWIGSLLAFQKRRPTGCKTFKCILVVFVWSLQIILILVLILKNVVWNRSCNSVTFSKCNSVTVTLMFFLFYIIEWTNYFCWGLMKDIFERTNMHGAKRSI